MQRYFNNVANQRGAAIAGASVLVKNFSDLTTATVYSTNSAIAGNVKTNPLTSDSDGGFWFYAADGHYSLVIIPSGGSTSTISDILLEDPSDSTVPVALAASTATWAIAAGAASTATIALSASTSTWSIGGGTSSYSGTSGSAASAAVAAIASTATTALAASTATAAITASTATSVKGTITNDDAVAGFVGEFISTTNTADVPMGNGTSINVATATITPGDWDAEGMIDIVPAATTALTRVYVGISSTSAATGPQGTFGSTVFGNFAPGTNEITLHCPWQRISVGGTTTMFLVGSAVFTTSSLNAHGNMNFRRIR